MMNSQDYSYTVKLVIIGDSGVGKTNLLLRYCDGGFNTSYVPTIGVDFKIKTIVVDGWRLKLQIWDTAGQQRFKTINQAYYKGSAGIILVYSTVDQTSFDNIGTYWLIEESWMKQINQFAGPEVRKILVANKLDLTEQRKVSRQAGQKCATRFGIKFMEVSAHEGVNVPEVFFEIAKQIKLVLELEEKSSGKTKLKIRAKDVDKCVC